MVGPGEMSRRLLTRHTHRVSTLPILALHVHSSCNCRCVMCDIWKANAAGREMPATELERHLEGLRRLRVERVMLTGGEPLLHSNLWALCAMLRAEGIAITLITTGLLIERHLSPIAEHVDELVVSIDGDATLHDQIRRVNRGFARIAHAIGTLNAQPRRPRTTARCVVQRQNHEHLSAIVEAVHHIKVDRLSFLAADVSSSAFNRPTPWDAERRAQVALGGEELPQLAHAITQLARHQRSVLQSGFVLGGLASLWRIHRYYAALAGLEPFPRVSCNAPWMSAVLEVDGRLRPCFFQPAYEGPHHATVQEAINAPGAIAFRRSLNVEQNEICQRCVCSLALPFWARV
jgi:Fe-coproporphyrin III synthase